MEAEDRVTQTTEENCHNTLVERLLEQDRISFKAGYFEGRGLGIRDGIREVVEWIKEQQYECGNPDDMAYHWLLIPPEDWQAKLKEWGIE